jgi:hypothetical protein
MPWMWWLVHSLAQTLWIILYQLLTGTWVSLLCESEPNGCLKMCRSTYLYQLTSTVDTTSYLFIFYLFIYIFVCPSIHPPTHSSIHLFIYISIYLYIYIYISVCLCLSIYPSIHVSSHLFMHLFIYLQFTWRCHKYLRVYNFEWVLNELEGKWEEAFLDQFAVIPRNLPMWT